MSAGIRFNGNDVDDDDDEDSADTMVDRMNAHKIYALRQIHSIWSFNFTISQIFTYSGVFFFCMFCYAVLCCEFLFSLSLCRVSFVILSHITLNDVLSNGVCAHQPMFRLKSFNFTFPLEHTRTHKTCEGKRVSKSGERNSLLNCFGPREIPKHQLKPKRFLITKKWC